MSRRTKAQWQALIAEQFTSGMTATRYCREQGLNETYFSLQKRRLHPCDSSRFVKVIPDRSPSQNAHSSIKMGDSPPIFILGCGHSGTTLLLAMLSRHSHLYGIPYESSLFRRSAVQRGESFSEALWRDGL